jgi:CheY-like chemotaxis protein
MLPAMPARAPARRLLIAEDDEAARVMLAKFLEKRGFAVTQVTDGQQALDALSKPNDFDLVVLDVMMPHLTGFDVLERVRAAGATVPIVMATAAASNDDVVKAVKLGADDYVTKSGAGGPHRSAHAHPAIGSAASARAAEANAGAQRRELSRQAEGPLQAGSSA